MFFLRFSTSRLWISYVKLKVMAVFGCMPWGVYRCPNIHPKTSSTVISRWKKALGNFQSSLSSQRPTAEEMRDHQVTEFDDHQTSDDHQIIGMTSKPPLQQDWILLAAAIDRLSIVIYAIVFVILAIVFSLWISFVWTFIDLLAWQIIYYRRLLFVFFSPDQV